MTIEEIREVQQDLYVAVNACTIIPELVKLIPEDDTRKRCADIAIEMVTRLQKVSHFLYNLHSDELTNRSRE